MMPLSNYLPKDFIGATTKNGGLTKNNPRKWSDKEVEWALGLKNRGYTNKEVAKYLYRGEVSVAIKLKRLAKKQMVYNPKHLAEKTATNYDFVEMVKPNSVLDAYAGLSSIYKELAVANIVSNDINKKADTDYHLDALAFMCKMFFMKNKFDIVDLDPFGSAYDSFDLAVKMAKKGLVVTLGEMGHKRWGRLDFVKRYYGIEKMEDFTTTNLINHIVKIGARNKKLLTPVFIKEWRNISRVYFMISEIKITEQWEK